MCGGASSRHELPELPEVVVARSDPRWERRAPDGRSESNYTQTVCMPALPRKGDRRRAMALQPQNHRDASRLER